MRSLHIQESGSALKIYVKQKEKKKSKAKQREKKEALPGWWGQGGREKKGDRAPQLQRIPSFALAGPGIQGRNGKYAGVGLGAHWMLVETLSPV